MLENCLFSLPAEENEAALFDPARALWAQCDAAAIDRLWNGDARTA
jgi:hypothetical protein